MGHSIPTWQVLHPRYGRCEAMNDGECSECARVALSGQAEIARLLEQLHAADMDCLAVEAERNDYRVALTEIMEYCEGWPNDAAHMAVKIARAALRGEEAT